MKPLKIKKVYPLVREPPRYHILWLYDELLQDNIYPYIKKVYLSDNYYSMTLLIKSNRYRSTVIHIFRTSRYCFRICLYDKMFTRKNYKSALFTIKNLIKKELKLCLD